MSSSLTNQDWEFLRELKDSFLTQQRNYWKSSRHLELYDQFFAQRIGWKWQAVLNELKGTEFSCTQVLDWGCGTGIASRTLLKERSADTVFLFDQSSSAVDYAEKAIRSEFPNVVIQRGIPKNPYVLLLSHVLNELTQPQVLDSLLANAKTVLWVEPGTKESSAALVEWREKLRTRFYPLAPCAHDAVCGLQGNSKDWCHHFAPTPTSVFQSADWKAFSTNVGIDLRSLPLSYLVLVPEKPSPADKFYREIGTARFYKGYLKTLLCDESGVRAARLLKKSDPKLFQSWEDFHFSRRVPEGTRALQFEKR